MCFVLRLFCACRRFWGSRRPLRAKLTFQIVGREASNKLDGQFGPPGPPGPPKSTKIRPIVQSITNQIKRLVRHSNLEVVFVSPLEEVYVCSSSTHVLFCLAGGGINQPGLIAYLSLMLRNSASWPYIGLPGRILAGLLRPISMLSRSQSGQNPARKADFRPGSIIA